MIIIISNKCNFMEYLKCWLISGRAHNFRGLQICRAGRRVLWGWFIKGLKFDIFEVWKFCTRLWSGLKLAGVLNFYAKIYVWQKCIFMAWSCFGRGMQIFMTSPDLRRGGLCWQRSVAVAWCASYTASSLSRVPSLNTNPGLLAYTGIIKHPLNSSGGHTVDPDPQQNKPNISACLPV